MSESLGNSSVSHGFLEKIAETDGSLEFEWKIPDFFIREHEYNYCVQSPKFDFLGAECILCLRFFLCSNIYYIAIVCKMKDGYPDLLTKASIEIKCSDGTVYKSVHGAMEVRPALRCAITRLFLSQSELLLNKTKIAPQGVVTISCSLDVAEETTADSTMQTEISPGIFKLGKNLKDLLASREHSDVVMKVGDKEFRTHKAILAARSTVFASMFRHDMKECCCGTVDITDCDPEEFEQFLLYVYTGKVDCLSTENVCQLYQLSDKYDIQDLKTECVEYMKENLSADNFCDVISLALRHNESELIASATRFFVKNAKKNFYVGQLAFFFERKSRGGE